MFELPNNVLKFVINFTAETFKPSESGKMNLAYEAFSFAVIFIACTFVWIAAPIIAGQQ